MAPHQSSSPGRNPGLPDKERDFEDWYRVLITRAEIVDETPVKGCLALRPYGFAIWALLRQRLAADLASRGYQDASFPSFIPRSQLAKVDEHYASFVREAVVCSRAGDETFPEDLIVRPTSEAIMYPILKRWIRSKKDLPLKINQWCNTVRWEILKPNFPLIRDNEFLWHECHSVHATEEECDAAVNDIFQIHKRLLLDAAAIPCFEGEKPARRKFAGAKYTLALEAMMGNRVSVQIATSHSLGQNFSTAYGITFDDEGNERLAWQACSGLTTRVIGCLAMVHGDQHGLILPPELAPYQVAVVDSLDEKERAILAERFRVIEGGTVEEWTLKGVPVIIAGNHVHRRDTLAKEGLRVEGLAERIREQLDAQQHAMLESARKFKEAHTLSTESYDEMRKHISSKSGFCVVAWCGEEECARTMRHETKGSLRVVRPLHASDRHCIKCGKPARDEAVFGQSY